MISMSSPRIRLSRRELLRVVGISASSLVCASCTSNPFFSADSKPPEAAELLHFDAAGRSRAEVLHLAAGDDRRVFLRQRYLKLVAGRHGSEHIVGEKFSFAPREEDGGISLAELDVKKLAALLRDPRVKEEYATTWETVVGHPIARSGSGQYMPDLPLMGLTPSLLVDDRFRVSFQPEGTAARLTKPFELDLQRDRWYAILLDVSPTDNPDASREHLCCLRIELSERPPTESD